MTRARRLTAGRLLALVYALCVLAPTLSFALPGSQAVSPCLTDANHVPGMTHIHADAASTHQHADASMNDHAAAHSHAGASHDATSTLASAVVDQMPSDQAPAKGFHGSGGECCGLMCLTALPATLVEVVTPAVPAASRQIARDLAIADNGPARLYRPPIA